MEIYLIRHTKVAVRAGTLYGQADVGTASTFEKEAEVIYERLKDPLSISYLSSPLTRCTKLASYLLAKNERAPNFLLDERLKELNFGNWELLPWQSIPSEAFKEWTENFVSMKCPKGESFRDLYHRVESFWQALENEELIKKIEGKRLAIITHGGVIRAILARLLGISLKNVFTIKINYASVSKIRRHAGHYTIDFVNSY